MDRKTFLKSASLILGGGIAPSALATNFKIEADKEIRISEGPYLTAVDKTEATVVFMTNKRAIAKVEVVSNDDANFAKPKAFFDSDESLGRKHIGTLHTVQLYGLKPNMTYSYKIEVIEVVEFWEEKRGIKYGSTKLGTPLRCDKYPKTDVQLSLKTLSDNNEDFSFFVINDVHEKSNMAERMLSNMSDERFLVLNGDMSHTYKNETHIFKAFMSSISNTCKGGLPIFYARGNHECRGKYSEPFMRYFPSTTGKTYYMFNHADTAFLFLDLCEDKPDNHVECGNITDFQSYKEKESEWLKKVISSEEFKNAKRRIAIMHILPFDLSNWKFAKDVNKFFGNILNEANIDLAICGHFHKQMIVNKNSFYKGRGRKGEIGSIKVKFPIFVNSNTDSVKVSISKDGIKLKVFSDKDSSTKEFNVNNFV